MLSPRSVNCVGCTTPANLILDIDCKLTDLANNQYNNIVFMLGLPFNQTVIGDLLNYKRILVNKICNPDYAQCYTVEMIASRVKILIHK
jgi:hypothetical protein